MKPRIQIEIPETVLARPEEFWDPTVAVDADEVLVRFIGQAERHINARRQAHGQRPADLCATQTYFFHGDPRVGLTAAEEAEAIKQLALATQGGMGSLEFYNGAVGAMKSLRASGIQPFVMTHVPSALDTSGAHEQRYGWGSAQAGRTEQFMQAGIIRDAEDLIFCRAAEKPAVMLDGIYHIPLLVDDRPSTLVSARWDYGLIAVGVRTAATRYNQGAFEGITWFDSLADAVPEIKRVFAELSRRHLIGTAPHIKRRETK
jgi:hypothetical protein